MSLYNGTAINSWKASCFCYDYSIITFLSSAPSAGNYTSLDAVGSGSGYRFFKAVITFSTGSIDMTHAVYIMPFIYSVVAYRPTLSDVFVTKVSLEIINSTNYYRVHATDGNCRLFYLSQYRITYDQTTVQSSQQTYLDAQFFVVTNGASNPYSLIFSDPTNYHAGINHYNFAGGTVPSFSFDTVAFTLSSAGANLLNLSTINYRYRSCVSPTIYFMESQNLCYDVCPASYYPVTTSNYCASCYPGCLTCSGSSSTACSTCNTTANRTLNGTACPCVTTLYDSGVIQCQPCSPGCYGCTGTATNCTTCPSNAQRTQSGSSCPCNSGYVDNGTAVCATCGSIIPGCLTCTSTTNCTTCDSSQYMSLNTTTRLCYCTAGNYRSLVGGVCVCNSGYI